MGIDGMNERRATTSMEGWRMEDMEEKDTG